MSSLMCYRWPRFESLAALEAHLAAWMIAADTRLHGTTHERPLDRFEL